MEKEKKSLKERFMSLSVGGKVILIMLILLVVMVVIGLIVDNANSSKSILTSSDVGNNRNNKLCSFVEKSNGNTGLHYTFTKEEFEKRYLSILETYNKDSIGLGLVENKMTKDNVSNDRQSYTLGLYRITGGGNVSLGKTEYMLSTIYEEQNSSNIVEVRATVDATISNKLKETVLSKDIPYLYSAIDNSITYEKAYSIIEQLFNKAETTNKPLIYQDGVLYTMSNTKDYLFFSAVAITEEKAKELYDLR